jgi:serine/threonine protein kinase
VSKIFTITEGLENMGALRTGGQGSVYKGRRMGPIITAVKVLPTPIHAEDAGDRNFRNFQNEVGKLKIVNANPNPNVVKILSSGLTESGSLPYIEMEYIEGPDLEELLKPPHDPVFTIKETLKLADHLANALAHCHLAGVKHGDVKSNNVKYNLNTGNYMLLDFGLAILSEEERRTSIRHAGAIEFMAPEQNTGAMYFQTDIYSFGIILYELLAGQVPFQLHDSGETDRNAVMVAHMESNPPDLVELRSKNLPTTWPADKKEAEMHVPQWLLQVIATCLEKDPQKRYANGMALQEALFRGGVGTEEPVAGSQTLDILKQQNAALAAQLQAKTGPAGDAAFIKIPRSLATLVVIILIGILLFGAYGMLKKPEVRVVVKRDTIVKIKKLPPDTVLKYVPSQDVNPADSTLVSEKPHKKKRKKFLGIF